MWYSRTVAHAAAAAAAGGAVGRLWACRPASAAAAPARVSDGRTNADSHQSRSSLFLGLAPCYSLTNSPCHIVGLALIA